MPANYVATTIADFNALLTAAKGWTQTVQGREFVFEFRVPSNRRILVRVFTGIDCRNGAGRPRGGDAIRIVGIYTGSPDHTTGRGLYKAKRTHRTENWRERVRERVTETILECKQRVAGGAVAYPRPYRPARYDNRGEGARLAHLTGPLDEADFHDGTI